MVENGGRGAELSLPLPRARIPSSKSQPPCRTSAAGSCAPRTPTKPQAPMQRELYLTSSPTAGAVQVHEKMSGITDISCQVSRRQLSTDDPSLAR
eukprot:scaffold101129_cov34-Phaeocystis_antarctica.AAC.2